MPLTATVVPEKPVVGLMVIPCPTVKVAVAELPALSWAFMVWLPRALAGIVKTAPLKVPLEVVIAVPTFVLSKWIITLELAAKPLPLTVTVSPTRPEAGVTFIFSRVTKFVVAKLPALS